MMKCLKEIQSLTYLQLLPLMSLLISALHVGRLKDSDRFLFCTISGYLYLIVILYIGIYSGATNHIARDKTMLSSIWPKFHLPTVEMPNVERAPVDAVGRVALDQLLELQPSRHLVFGLRVCPNDAQYCINHCNHQKYDY
jgi:hypothetical protein